VFDGDGDGDVDDDDEALIDSASHDMYRRHPLLISESHLGNQFMWTGQRYDAEAKLYHFKYRSYNPDLGRWLQRDPLGYVDTDSLREYVGSNPLRYVDPFGLEGDEEAESGKGSKENKGKNEEENNPPKHSDVVYQETAGLRPQWKDKDGPKKRLSSKKVAGPVAKGLRLGTLSVVARHVRAKRVGDGR
jgi:RHS repeat-associated protein